ncbi:MAG: A/G-specific adenine glycosylase [Actinomycetes bacterium]
MTRLPGSVADRVSAWYAGAGRDLPWRRPGVTPWGVLVSEVMLQQTPVSRVLPAYVDWMRRWPRPGELAAESTGAAVRQWGRLGYPRRALALHAAATAIGERHAGSVPRELQALLALPGVGGYTARAVAVFAYGDRHPVVDTNVRRVVTRHRLGLGLPASAATTAADLELVAGLLPADPKGAATTSVALMELGALVCTARLPRCAQCPLAGDCAWRLAGAPTAPAKRGQTYAGTDRQARGRLLAVLRDAHRPVSTAELASAWPTQPQRDRALAGLLADGLATETNDGGYALP